MRSWEPRAPEFLLLSPVPRLQFHVTSPGVVPGWIQEVASVWQPRAWLLRNSSKYHPLMLHPSFLPLVRDLEKSLVLTRGELLAKIAVFGGIYNSLHLSQRIRSSVWSWNEPVFSFARFRINILNVLKHTHLWVKHI